MDPLTDLNPSRNQAAREECTSPGVNLAERAQRILALRRTYNVSGHKGEDIQLIMAALAAAPSDAAQPHGDGHPEHAESP